MTVTPNRLSNKNTQKIRTNAPEKDKKTHVVTINAYVLRFNFIYVEKNALDLMDRKRPLWRLVLKCRTI